MKAKQSFINSMRAAAALLLTLTLAGLTSCGMQDNPVETSNVPAVGIVGKWYAENSTPGTINVDGISIDYQKVVQYANFRADGTGFWSIIFVNGEDDAIDIPNHFCGGSFNYFINGNTVTIGMTDSGIPVMEDNWDVTYGNGTLSVNVAEAPNILVPISPENDDDCQIWLRQLGFGGDGPLLLKEANGNHYGMVVCTEGHLHEAKTRPPQGCTAVGVLGKVTKKGHGLILALRDAPSKNWDEVNGWKTVTAYAGTKLKLLPDDDDTRGPNLKGYTKLGNTIVSNWCVAQKSDYESIFKNLGSTRGDEDGLTYDDNVNAYFKNSMGARKLGGVYLSATECDRGTSWDYHEGMWFSRAKSMGDHLRPVLGF